SRAGARDPCAAAPCTDAITRPSDTAATSTYVRNLVPCMGPPFAQGRPPSTHRSSRCATQVLRGSRAEGFPHGSGLVERVGGGGRWKAREDEAGRGRPCCHRRRPGGGRHR